MPTTTDNDSPPVVETPALDTAPAVVLARPAEVDATSHSRAQAWAGVVDVLRRHYKNPDIKAARLLYSAVAAHGLTEYPPAWMLAIAPPGSAKTDLLESLRGLPRVFFVDEVTPKTFISGKVDEPGQKRTKPASLLSRIGTDGILIAADFSTYTSDPRTLGAILSQLRRIYDGNFSREFGTDEHIEERTWAGRLTLFAGAVPDIDRHYSLFQKLGERFLRVRWPRAGGVETGKKAMRHTNRLAEELRRASHSLLLPILESNAPAAAPVLSEEVTERIAALGELVALVRSHVERDRWNREIVELPVTEGNTRLPQQLAQIARGSALLDGRAAVSEGDYQQLISRAAFDSMPPARRAVVVALGQGKSPYSVGLPSGVAHRALEELRAVGIASRGGSDETATLTNETQALIHQAGLGFLLSRDYV